MQWQRLYKLSQVAPDHSFSQAVMSLWLPYCVCKITLEVVDWGAVLGLEALADCIHGLGR